MTQTMEQIKRDIVDHLFWDSRLDASKVKVEVDDGKVILTGTVPTFYAWESAQKDALLVPGVVSVENKLQVEHPQHFEIPLDETIKNNIENMLCWNPDIDARDIVVIVNSGAVMLEVSVGSYWAKILAQKLASQVRGVVQVANEILIVPTKRQDDKNIAKEIMASLQRVSFIDQKTINIKVEDGGVTLSGAVTNLMEHQIVLDACYFTDGVIKINDQLIIR
jgi:osmotically-inducible protein OsmY